jgi:RNA polymerase sigma-70 factor (ECF subfamily)
MNPDKSLLIQNLVDGDKETYTQLFKAYYKNLCACSYKIVKDVAIAEEVVQNVFFRIWERRSSLGLNENIEKYLYKAVHNESIDVYRKTCFENDFKNQLKHDPFLQKESIYDPLSNKELAAKLQTAIDKLPGKSKEIFLLSRYASLSYKEISEKIGITTKGVEFHIIKALKILRVELKDFRYFILFLLTLQ